MATSETRQMVGLLLKNDPTVEQNVRIDVLRIIDGKTMPGLADDRPMDRALTRDEVAKRMGVKPRTVTYYARRGIIRPLRFGVKGVRASGYSEQSVNAAMAAAAGA